MRIFKGALSVGIILFFMACSTEPELQLTGEEESAVNTEKEYNQAKKDIMKRYEN